MSIDLVTPAGVREVLGLTPTHEARLETYAKAGRLHLKQLVGAANYALLRAQDDSITVDQQDAAALAGAKLGAAYYYEDRIKAAGARGVISMLSVGEGSTETFASAEECRRAIREYRNGAERLLRGEGLYVPPANLECTGIELADDEDA